MVCARFCVRFARVIAFAGPRQVSRRRAEYLRANVIDMMSMTLARRYSARLRETWRGPAKAITRAKRTQNLAQTIPNDPNCWFCDPLRLTTLSWRTCVDRRNPVSELLA